MSGILYVVATPIGNLEDITYRATRILGEVGLIACEDTRHTRKLLEHYGISTPLISYHEHNETARAQEIADRLAAGTHVALVSDAGTPLVSDPGYRLVKTVTELGFPVVPVPGPSAALAALSASGLATDQFRFGGFLAPKSSHRRKVLEALKSDSATLVFYEAPHRILDSLADVEAVLGSRPIVLAREITKLHEEFLRGTAATVRAALAERPAVKGELTLLIGREPEPAEPSQQNVAELFQTAVAAGLSRMDAIKHVSRQTGLPKREVYRRIEAAALNSD